MDSFLCVLCCVLLTQVNVVQPVCVCVLTAIHSLSFFFKYPVTRRKYINIQINKLINAMCFCCSCSRGLAVR